MCAKNISNLFILLRNREVRNLSRVSRFSEGVPVSQYWRECQLHARLDKEHPVQRRSRGEIN